MPEPKKVENGKYSKQFPELRGILAGYFHEDMFDVFDWDGHKKDYKSIVCYHKSIQNKEYLRKEISELKEFLAAAKEWDEDTLGDVLGDDFSCMFYAPFFKLTYRDFLNGILEILEEPIEKTKSEFIPKFTG